VRQILVIGIGTGNPEHVTIQAIRALNTVDVVFVLDKGGEKADLVALRREICERYDLPYNTGGLAKQFGSVVGKICKLALPWVGEPRRRKGSAGPDGEWAGLVAIPTDPVAHDTSGRPLHAAA
jgi:hypothetical protein